jgi:hypothetical protein
MEKKCFKCKETKLLSDFYAHPAMGDGYLGKCKTCTKRDTAERTERLRRNPAWLASERKRCRIKQANYRAIGLAAKTTTETRLRWRSKNEHKIMAHKIAYKAMKAGKIIRAKSCEKCGAVGELEMHHPDYLRPTRVQWLCLKCHGETRHKDSIDLIP